MEKLSFWICLHGCFKLSAEAIHLLGLPKKHTFDDITGDLLRQLRIKSSGSQLLLQHPTGATGSVAVAFVDKTLTEQTFMYYSPVQNLIGLGDINLKLYLMGSQIECQNKKFYELCLGDIPNEPDGLYKYANGILSVVGTGYADNLITTHKFMRFPTTIPASPANGQSYYDPATNTLWIWN